MLLKIIFLALPDWLQAIAETGSFIVAFIALIISCVVIGLSRKIKTLTDVVEQLSDQNKILADQTKELSKQTGQLEQQVVVLEKSYQLEQSLTLPERVPYFKLHSYSQHHDNRIFFGLANGGQKAFRTKFTVKSQSQTFQLDGNVASDFGVNDVANFQLLGNSLNLETLEFHLEIICNDSYGRTFKQDVIAENGNVHFKIPKQINI